MTTIAASQYSAYSAYSTYNNATSSSSAQQPSNTARTSETDSATTITLSDAAKSALAEDSFSTVTAKVRTRLDELLSDKDLNSPYVDGKLAIDLAGLDRRALFAVASNGEGQFTTEEQYAANEELARRFDAAMTGPAAVTRVTGDRASLYDAARTYLDDASPEEKATSAWRNQSEAVSEVLKQLTQDADTTPLVAGDPVADYLARAEVGDTAAPRAFADVASDARAALDKQIADAEAMGSELVFSALRKSGQMVDFSAFSSRTLSAISLNEGDNFSEEETRAARSEVRSRAATTLLACCQNASTSSDPTALSQNIISAFASLSPEERFAAGWSDDFYETAVVNYRSAASIASMFGSAETGSGKGLLDYI